MTYNDLCDMGIFEEELSSASILAETLGRNGVSSIEIKKILEDTYKIRAPWKTHARYSKSEEDISTQKEESNGIKHEKISPSISKGRT